MQNIADWTMNFTVTFGHFMPMGFRMGQIAMRELDLERVQDHGVYALTEMGLHPQNCMNDVIIKPLL